MVNIVHFDHPPPPPTFEICVFPKEQRCGEFIDPKRCNFKAFFTPFLLSYLNLLIISFCILYILADLTSEDRKRRVSVFLYGCRSTPVNSAQNNGTRNKSLLTIIIYSIRTIKLIFYMFNKEFNFLRAERFFQQKLTQN